MEWQFNFTTNANLVLCVSVKTLTECVLYSQACGGTFEGSHSEGGNTGPDRPLELNDFICLRI